MPILSRYFLLAFPPMKPQTFTLRTAASLLLVAAVLSPPAFSFKATAFARSPLTITFIRTTPLGARVVAGEEAKVFQADAVVKAEEAELKAPMLAPFSFQTPRYSAHHPSYDTRFNRKCYKTIPARRLPNSTVRCPDLIVTMRYIVDDHTGQVSTKEGDSEVSIFASGLITGEVQHLARELNIHTILASNIIQFDTKVQLKYLDVEAAGKSKEVKSILLVAGSVNYKKNTMKLDYKCLQ